MSTSDDQSTSAASAPDWDALERGDGRLVCVTGAAGFLGTHAVQLLLEKGFRVRAVVRDASNDDKVAHLRDLLPDAGDRLELASADLLVPGSHDEAMRDAELVLHMASSVRLVAKDPQREIVDVAVEGTRNVLQSVKAAGCAKRVVVTSSVAAILDDGRPKGHVFTEEDWNDSSSLGVDPYNLSKSLAERAAWEFQRDLPEAEHFELATVNPQIVLGPVFTKSHLRSSPATVRSLLAKQMPAVPRLNLGFVDVRDVALAHLRALVLPAAAGRRYLLHAEALWMRDLARMLASQFPECAVPTMPFPTPLFLAVALFSKRLNFQQMRRTVGKVMLMDASRSRTELGITYRPIEDSVRDTARSMLDRHFVRPKK